MFARRTFLKTLGAGASLLAWRPWHAMAGPFTRADFDRLVPADKKLHPDWVQSLTERGQPTVYRGRDLEKIGMPIGGLCAGQVYLGGDGRLWHWDIFNQRISTGAEHYAKPLKPSSPVNQGFGVRYFKGIQWIERSLDNQHWSEVSFNGEYPIGRIEYRDAEAPLSIKLEAYSPFIPLNTEDSSLPATVFEFTLSNHSKADLKVELSGWLENAVCLFSGAKRGGTRQNHVTRKKDYLILECSAVEVPEKTGPVRPDIVFADFEAETYGKWVVTGTAFGNGPIATSQILPYQGEVGGIGNRVVNTHASAPGKTVEERDSATGTLTSPPFKIERRYISFLIGGGAHQGRTCMNLLIDGKVMLSATGQNNNRMQPQVWQAGRWEGKTAQLQIVDKESGPWGNVGVDQIVFTDRPNPPPGPLASEPDFGTLGLALLEPTSNDSGTASHGHAAQGDAGSASGPVQPNAELNAAAVPGATCNFEEKLVGALTRRLRIPPGRSATATFVLAWHMPNLKLDRLSAGRHYGQGFVSAEAVTAYLARNFERLRRETRLWHETWYDSTLPYWFLDRTFLNTSILATTTCHRLGNGRFYGWEGVGCCEGTCGHVWQYAHAVARLFPDLERGTRENVDFGLAQQPDGSIHFRGEFNDFPAIDAQAGSVLRALREHQMSPDSAFLNRTWPRIKRATEWLITKDANGDGLIESNQHNTLDTDWFGPVAWLSGLYLAALSAAEVMAREVGDEPFAAKCRGILDAGQGNFVGQLFQEDYFINKPDMKHPDAINSGSGCEIDQVFGQSWAFQVGLPRVIPREQTVAALKSLWRYNFTPDVGPYREIYKPGRWYAMPGEAGLLMCTFPRSDWDYAQAKGKGPDWAAGYFNECMNGFEYQAAGHMIWEGLVTEGLAVTRAIHDRYHPARRNPWNEVECGDHYARSMASYGVFLAACGFEYHGPKARLGFAPRINPEEFKAAFTAAEGWGTYVQRVVKEHRKPGSKNNKAQETHSASSSGRLECSISSKWGKLRLKTLTLALPSGVQANRVHVALQNGHSVESEYAVKGERLMIRLGREVTLSVAQSLQVSVG